MKYLLCICVCCVMLTSIFCAYAANPVDSLVSMTDLPRSVPSEAKTAVKNLDLESGFTLDDGIEGLWAQIVKQFHQYWKLGLRSFLLLLICTLFLGLAEGLWSTGGATSRPVQLIGVLVIAAVSFGDINALLTQAKTALQEVENFSKVMLPMLMATSVAAGSPTAAVARHTATVLFSDVLITVINRFLLPCTYTYLAVITADAALGNQSLKSIGGLFKWGISFILKFLLTLYVAYISISGAIAGATDVMMEKSAKFAISGMIPVVGGIMAEATQTIVAGAGLMRNTIGIFGLIAVLGITITPLLRLGINFLLYKLAASIATPATPKVIMEYIEKLADVFGLVIGMTAASSLILLISIVSSMMSGMSG